MAQFCNCARLALSRTLFKFGKALIRFFEVVDCVSCLDSELDSESARDSVRLDSRLSLDSESALHSALGLPLNSVWIL